MEAEEIIGYLGEILSDEEDTFEPARKAVEDVYQKLTKGLWPSHNDILMLVNFLDESNMSPHYFTNYKIVTEALQHS